MADRPVRLPGWPGGVNNRLRETERGASSEGAEAVVSQFLREAINVDLTAGGHPLRRRGARKVIDGRAHSVWFCHELQRFFYGIGSAIYTTEDFEESFQIATAQNTAVYQMSYTFHAGKVYASNNPRKGFCYDPLGVTTPWPSGQDAPVGPQIFKPQQLGRTIESLLEDVEVDGSKTFAPSGATNADHLLNPNDHFVDTPERLYQPMRPGVFVTSHKGRLFGSDGSNYIWFSEPWRPDYTREATNYISWPGYVRMFEAVEGGIFVGTKTEVRFLAGDDPFEFKVRRVSPYGVVRYSAARVPGKAFDVPADFVVVWWGVDGTLMLGAPDGTVRPLSQNRVAAAEYRIGATSFREQDGMQHVVSSLQEPTGRNSIRATDTVVAEIRRNNL